MSELNENRAADLRRAFDRGFADAPAVHDADTVDLLAVRLGAEPYAIRLSEITGVFADKRVTPIPSAAPELLGIAGFRGAILPVYDLRRLLGYSSSNSTRWLVVASAKPVAFAFDAVDGHLRLRRDAIASNSDVRQSHALEVARTPAARPIVRLASVLEVIESKSKEVQSQRER